jgi:geranylgeranyl pyrophosphate synthase/predicted secreted hydrolase
MTISYLTGDPRPEEAAESGEMPPADRRESDVRWLRPVPRDLRKAAARPRDWPGPGPIDLRVHDLPHASSTTEWWYMNGHLTTEDNRRFSVFVAFFRQVKGRDPLTRRFQYVHSITWAITSVDDEKYVHYSGVDRTAPEEGLKRIRRGLGAKDAKLNRALAEVLERGHVPAPDRVFEGRVFVNLERLELEYSGDSFKKQDDGSYKLKLGKDKLRAGCELTFVPQKAPVRHGKDGVVKGSDDEDMFYYFIPRCELRGTLAYEGVEHRVAQGQGWYDHEFGVGQLDSDEDEADQHLPEAEKKARFEQRREDKEHRAVAWNWLSTQFDDGSELSCYPELYVKTNRSAGNYAIAIDRDGNRVSHDDMSLEPTEFWQSTQTFFEYPVGWHVSIPSAGIELDVRAAFHDQEFITLISKPSFWEGRVEVEGTIRGRTVRGVGFVERNGFTPFEDLDGYFEAVGKVVRQSVARVLPTTPDYETALNLVASDARPQYLDGLDLEQYGRTLLKPIREITDRGGKGWRSYAAITCCDIVGGDSRKFVEWLAMPELMHVGSLIVDDVEDRSVVRRGGPTAHVLYGEAHAINSGTAAYFITQKLLANSKYLSDADRLKIYDLYFEAMRAGHAGQAIDIDGFDHLLPGVVESGDAATLERRVLAVHRLKTAAPAGCLARMGAVAGGGSEAQIESLGLFFEALGLAFQIIDDVLNLRGFKGDLKSKGEDVQQGKITLPVAKALARLELEDRRWLYETLKSKPEDPAVIGRVIDLLESVGAIDACARHARDIVEEAWQALEPYAEDTLAKMMLRAFSWHILERHY